MSSGIWIKQHSALCSLADLRPRLDNLPLSKYVETIWLHDRRGEPYAPPTRATSTKQLGKNNNIEGQVNMQCHHWYTVTYFTQGGEKITGRLNIFVLRYAVLMFTTKLFLLTFSDTTLTTKHFWLIITNSLFYEQMLKS